MSEVRFNFNNILTRFSMVTLLPVKADRYRNFLLQVPTAQTDMNDADTRVFAKAVLLDKSSRHSNSIGRVTEYSGYIVGRCSCGTC